MEKTTTKKSTSTELVGQPKFDTLNALEGSLNFIRANSEEEVLERITSIRMPVKILSVYAKHNMTVAWFLTTAKIKKKE